MSTMLIKNGLMGPRSFLSGFDDLLGIIRTMTNSPIDFQDFERDGLKKFIKRPHNLYTVKDEDGNIQKLVFECVYTPFTKKDIRIIKKKSGKHSTLLIQIGSENHTQEEGVTMLYKTISEQTFSFSIPLHDDIDQENIKSVANEGILHIDLPIKVQHEEEEDEIQELEIQ